MHSLFSRGASERPPAAAEPGQRPEVMRRTALGENARLLFALSAIAAPFTLYWLILGHVVPFLVAAIWLVGAGATMILHRNGHFAEAAIGQVGVIMAGGALLAFADPAPADFGLAVAAMGPVLAALLAGRALRRWSWAAFGAIAAGALGLSMVGGGSGEPVLGGTGLVAVVIAMIVVAHSANRINLAYEVFDKTQLAAYRHLVEHLRDGVVRFSEEGEVLFASASTEPLFGCRAYELSGRGLGERLHVADRPAYLTAFADANRAGRARTIEVRMRRDEPEGPARAPRFFWAEIGFSPVPDPERADARREVVALVRDVTGRKDREAEMRAARKAAEEASSAKSRFLATIGHELRTPLNAVVGFSEMMVRGIGGELPDTQREYAGLIHRSGRHLLEVVGMLLDMSRIEAGRFEIEAEPIAPEALVEPSLAMLEAVAREKDVQLVRAVGKGLPEIRADERACRQILINLVSNAIKFSHRGGTVTVSLRRQGQSLNISVSDGGIGMDAAALERIGEPFFQVHGGLDRSYEGTGLGLSIVKGLVELHEGTLRAVSELGAGTTMTVLLPINGPSTKLVDTGTVTALRPDQDPVPTSQWQDEKRKAL